MCIRDSVITVLTYTNAPPIPARVTDAAGTTLFDKSAILRGQDVFLKYGLMEHGTLWGHGAYLGPDYSAEYLHRLVEKGCARLVHDARRDRRRVVVGLDRHDRQDREAEDHHQD